MANFDNVLNEKRKQEGFSIYEDGCGINLSFLGIPIARFNTDGLDLDSLRNEIDFFFNKNNAISDYCYDFCNKFYVDAKTIINNLCVVCGGNCRRLCKYAELSLRNIERINWTIYVLRN